STSSASRPTCSRSLRPSPARKEHLRSSSLSSVCVAITLSIVRPRPMRPGSIVLHPPERKPARRAASYTGRSIRPPDPETPAMSDSRHPYDRPSDPAQRHSAALTDGPDGAGARGMLKAIGFTDEDLAKPIVGVGTSWIETMPCNYNHRRLAESVKAGIRAAGGTPMEFTTISVSDGVSMGSEGMKASLVSREVVADSVELVARGHLFDGVVCVFGCDKTGPGSAMALGRLDIPGLALYSGTIYPGIRTLANGSTRRHAAGVTGGAAISVEPR